MVIFDQLRISDDGKEMYIDVHVNQADYFDNIYLDSIIIMTGDKVSETCPVCPTSDYIYRKDFEGNEKSASLVLTATDFIRSWEKETKKMLFKSGDFSKTLFFVYVKVKGTPSECIPCFLDKETTVGVTFDVNMLYQRVMGFTKQLADECAVPKGFVDFILLWNALKSSIETEHYVSAIKFFDLLFNGAGGTSVPVGRGCGCHG